MNNNTNILKLVGVILCYVLLGFLLKSVVDALSGLPTLWGHLFDDLASICEYHSMGLNIGLCVVLVALALHVLWLVLELCRNRQRAAHRNELRAAEERLNDMRPTVLVQEPEVVPAVREPEVRILWHAANGTNGKRILNFAMLRRQGGWIIGQPGHSDLGINDAGLAAKHLLLYVGSGNRLIIKHLESGREGSVRVNGKPLSPGKSVVPDGKTSVSLAASRIIIIVD